MALLSMWTCEHTERSVENVYELYGRHLHTYIHARGYTRSTYYTLVLSLAHTNTRTHTWIRRRIIGNALENLTPNNMTSMWWWRWWVILAERLDFQFCIWHAVRHMHRWLDLVSIVSIMVGMLPFAGPSLEFHSHISTHVCVSMCLNRSRVQMYEETI